MSGSSACCSSPTPTDIRRHASSRSGQELPVGDKAPSSQFNTVDVMMVDRPRCLIAGEWLVLGPLADGSKTRLTARTRGGWLKPPARKVPVIGPLVWPIAALIGRGPGELLHHRKESGMLLGLQARVGASGPIARVSAAAAP